MQFTKVHGLGNDFIILDGRTESRNYSALARKLCHRQTGIGADGLLIIENSNIADIRMRIVNEDGSEAEMCGNGIRCFAKYVYQQKIVDKTEFAVETLAGIMRPKLVMQGGDVTGVTVDMGEPVLECAEIPVVGEGRCVGREMTVQGQTLRYTTVLVGVPHTLIYVDNPTDKKWMNMGWDIEHASVFPKRSNVNFAKVVNDHTLEMRTFERGCGPTLACGTGACSAAVASYLNGETGRSVDVNIELGTLHIDWAEDNHVYMTGPAEIVFTGEIKL
ncbi:MAG: diaminopimelate epimerase [Firmicutes bacterium HGW-Firmicutes-9]|jgi:diaminopimelate epimerase|nr:MAG: diaminopimelate epimerase [Firmicutes bacterium HGW-Firmicutes-9]